MTIAVVLIAVAGTVLRLLFAADSLNADELSTRWMVAGRDLWDVIGTVHTDAEITPPLYFALAWLTTLPDMSAGLLRAPALIAGVATMPVVFAIGLRTVGRHAALVATALVALSPFLIFYSADARAYSLVVLMTALSTLAMLVALERRSTRWWVLYAACSCLAVYSHYTAVFLLAGQLAWLLAFHASARRPALVANAAAAVAFLPWLSGLLGDLDSGTTDILFALEPFDARTVRISVSHWLVGYPPAGTATGLRDLPGTLALILLALGLVLAAAGIAARPRRLRLDPPLVLVVVLAASAPLGELLVSAAGSNLLASGRNLAVSWPGVALTLAALLVAGRRPLAIAATGLVLGAFAIGAVKILGPDFRRPDYDAVASYIDRAATPRDAVADRASISPAGVPPALAVAFGEPHRIFYPGRADVRYDPFRIVEFPEPLGETVRRAAEAASGGRLYLVLAAGFPQADELLAAVPEGFREVERRSYRGSTGLELYVFEHTATGA
jgi:hypothetical protein